MADYIWKSDDEQFGVKAEPALRHENVEFDVAYVPDPRGTFRAMYRADAQTPQVHCLGAVDKSKEPGARAAVRAFAKLRAEEIKELRKEAMRRRELRQGARGRSS
jgi:hypothetical protein